MASEVLNTSEVWTLGIAAYAAVVSTFVLGWDAYKWLASGARIELSVSAGMKVFGGIEPDNRLYVSVKAYNVGDQPTTITNLGGLYYDSCWCAFVARQKPSGAFVITRPSETQPIPYRLDVGGQWLGLTLQTDDIVRQAKEGYLFFILYTVGGGRGHRARLKIRDASPPPA